MTENKADIKEKEGNITDPNALDKRGVDNIEKIVLDVFKRILEDNSGGPIRIEFGRQPQRDPIDRIEKVVVALCGKIDALVGAIPRGIDQIQPKVEVQPTIQAVPTVNKVPSEPLKLERKRMDYFIIDLTHVLNYIYNKNDGTTVDDMVDTFVKAIANDKPDLVIGYLYANPNFRNVAYETRLKITSRLEENGISIGVGGFHVFTPYGHKGYMQSGALKCQDSDVFIIDCTGEMIRVYGTSIKTFFIVSGDVDTMPALVRVKGNNIATKVISFDDALSKDVENFVGRENCIPII